MANSARHPADRRLETLMGVRDHQLDPVQAAADQALEERRPEGLRLARADVQPHDLPFALRIGRDSDYRRHADDTALFALLEIGGVEPETRRSCRRFR